MTRYTEDTPLTPELLVWAVALELKAEQINTQRVGLYLTQLRQHFASDEEATAYLARYITATHTPDPETPTD